MRIRVHFILSTCPSYESEGWFLAEHARETTGTVSAPSGATLCWPIISQVVMTKSQRHLRFHRLVRAIAMTALPELLQGSIQ